MATQREKFVSYEIRIILLGVEPPVWRRVRVPRDLLLVDLHAVIHAAMGWDDDHLHEFKIGKTHYRTVEDEDEFFMENPPGDENEVRLNEVARPRSVFRYLYDFGDSWLHELRVERSVTSDTNERTAKCLAGENACPSEDSGGSHYYTRVIEVLANPAHADYSEMSSWFGEDFDPWRFDLQKVNKRLERFSV